MVLNCTLILVFEIKPTNRGTVRRMDVIQCAEINTGAVGCVERIHIRFPGQISLVGFQTGGDEPLAGRLLLRRDLFDVCFVRMSR